MSHEGEKTPTDNVRRALLEVIHTGGDHDDESHPDERWLVSYADMMTLLFGLFVLLFSMATLKKDQAEAIRKSTEEKFSKSKPADQTQVDPTEALKKQIGELRAAALARDEDVKKEKIEAEERAKESEKELKALKRAEKQKDTSKDEVAAQVAQLEERAKDLEKKNKELEQNAKREVASVNKSTELQKQLDTSEQARRELEQLKAELEKKLQKPEAGQGSMQQQSFIAFFINWSSKDHDIDMTIQDPNGNSFDFKKRKFPGQPGLFALDTRRGPGAELWQSDRLIPGVYKATYLFYNQYGNNAPATISGTIFTPKGSTEVPPVELTIDKKRKFQVRFEVDKDGNVKMLDSK